MKRKHIFLTGFMGSGKSTIGPPVAHALGFSFVDLDDEIEREEKRSIEDIFAVSGEHHFRSLELDYVKRCMGKGETVFALGGGTVTIDGIIEFLKKHGILIYLKTDTDELVARLHGHTHRPLLRGTEEGKRGEAELRRRISEMLDKREAYYRQADIVVETTRLSVTDVVENILNKIVEVMEKDDKWIFRKN